MTTSSPGLYDYHVHSNCSDGAFSPAELVARASTLGLKGIAIADHDSVSGVGEAMTVAPKYDLTVVPAVELSVCFDSWQDIHLLGFGIDHTDTLFLDRLNSFRERRERRNIDILARINDRLSQEGRGQIGLDEVLVHARDTIGRPHIARALLEKGLVANVEDAFKRYLIPCNVPKLYWEMEDAITEVKRIGGLAVLAHPTSITHDLEELQVLIKELHKLGLDGVEVFNNQAQPQEMEAVRRLAQELGLVCSAGSDFHGIEEGLEMGRGRGGIQFNEILLAPFHKRLQQLKSNSCL